MKNSQLASWLGYAGLIPFIVLAALDGWGPSEDVRYQHALIAYGATILAFLGGVHWGRALQVEAPFVPGRLLIAVTPQLVGWIALLLQPAMGIALLVAGLIMMLAVDLDGIRRGLFPSWYRRLRWILTTVATAALVLSLG